MKYAIISDTHDNYYNLGQTIKLIKESGIQTCLHLGDYCSPEFVKAMVAHEGLNWIGVWGNVDGARTEIVLDQANKPNLTISTDCFRELDLPEGKVFLVHFPFLARQAAESGHYVAVFYGHNHTKKVEMLANGTLLANPGELAGLKTGQPSFGIWDTDTKHFEIVDLKNFRVAR